MRLAADANVLLSALAGGAAARVLSDPRVEAFAPAPVIDEIEAYLPRMARRYGLDEPLLRLALASLPLSIVEPSAYRSRMADALRRIGKRDPDDADLLALALAMKVPVWSNDNDFEGTGVEWLTTAEVIRRLESEP